MKITTRLLACLLLFSSITSCSKKDATQNETGTTPDLTNCLLSNVAYENKPEMPYELSNVTLKYDAQKRLILKSAGGVFTEYIYQSDKIINKEYINSVHPANLVSEVTFTLRPGDSYITERVYRNVSSSYFDRTVYEYNAEGYLTSTRLYKNGASLARGSNFLYENGNLVSREDIYYETPTRPNDKVFYKYDNTEFYPEAAFLPEVTDIKTGKLNKNNIIEVTVEKTSINGWADNYKKINYNYIASGKRLAEVKMTATTAQGKSFTSNINLGYTCP